LFWFNRNSLFWYRSERTETNCLKQTVSKQTENTEKNEINRNKLKKTKKMENPTFSKYAPYQTVSVGLLFVSVQSKHRNSLFRYRSETTETNVLFWIVPKLVLVTVSVFSNQN
jgi:hypothetical protein